MHLIGFGIAREGGRPLTIEDIELPLKEGVSLNRIAMLIKEREVSFEVTLEVIERLAGPAREGDEVVIQVFERAAIKYVKKKVEEERRKSESESRILE